MLLVLVAAVCIPSYDLIFICRAAMFVGGFGYTLYSAQMLYLSNWWALSI